ncbi:tail fiber assembly protein [Enterobacter cloacae complex sp. ECC445]|uniref:tail fiber assembly protein n=1 Tax=Enterobacter cloacae complex sp. ECC445 TaxID=2913213 RepID=UPI001F312E41|nr:tail fiber assembly protein [Enterobacter cloacae complex sp. ECC445]MCG0454981.1 tail fiber assembly protein [Enterobacter cloacae complex sp. ECC445]
MTQAKLNSEFIATVAGNISVFNYDGDTREYFSSSVEYLAVGVGLPANSCTDMPGESKEGFAICRTADLSAWEYVADHRGETAYSTGTGEAIAITALGVYPLGTTTLVPATPYDKWNGSEWETDTKALHEAAVTEAEQTKIALLAEATAIIVPLADAQTGGYIDDADVSRLAEWQRYRYRLTKVETSTAPEIIWPEPPAV